MRFPTVTLRRHVAPALLVAGGLVIALVLLGVAAPRPASSPTATETTTLAETLAGWFRERSAAVHERTITLAALPRLAAAVATDAETVRDLTTDELAFRPHVDETIELGQRIAGKPVLLLRMPTGDGPWNFDRGGVVLEVMGSQLLLTETRSITPLENASSIQGMLAVTRRLDPTRLLELLDLPHGASLTIGGTTLGTVPSTAIDERTIAAPGAPTLRVGLGAPAIAASQPLRGAALLWFAGCLVGAWWLRRRPSSAAVRSVPEHVPTSITAEGSSRFGRYEPIVEIGRGGSAIVYIARSIGVAGFEKRVALKLLKPSLARLPHVVSSFLDEARLASHIGHPNVVQILDLGATEDQHYIAMELIDGTDLEQMIEAARTHERPIPIPIVIGVLRRICDGLHAAHTAVDASGRELSLVHRDVKAGNVLVSRDGAVKIGDFGIAKAKLQLHHSDLDVTKGTPAVMAPEQRTGGLVDQRADVFGVGVIAYEMLTNVPIDLDLERILVRGLEGWPHLTPLHELRPEVPEALERIILRVLAFRPADRHPDCAVLEAELARVAEQLGPPITDKDLAHWITGEIGSPTLRGWQSAAVSTTVSTPTPS